MFDRYSFVAITATDLGRARRFWVDQLGFRVTEERHHDFFIVDAGGLRLCVDRADGEIHVPGGTDPVIGFKVASLDAALAALAERGVQGAGAPVQGEHGRYAVVRDPDGRPVIVTEVD
jgi:catechol 2,3-dioxygenase-like lactoylglutathione lyase family enzyme